MRDELNRWVAMVALALSLASATALAKIPEGWPFLEFNEAVQTAQRLRKPMFVYFGFPTCPYCIYLNDHTFTDEALRKRYSEHYVLAYFDIRGNPDDAITLHSGEQVTRREAIKRLKASPVPAWMFYDPDGNALVMGRGSRTGVHAFVTYDLYVHGGIYKRMTLEQYLTSSGLRID